MPIFRVNRIVNALLSICVEAEDEDRAVDFATEDLFNRMASVGVKAHVEYHELDEVRETDADEKAQFPAPLLAFVERMARMTTPEDEFAEFAEEHGTDEDGAVNVDGVTYADADEMMADIDEERLWGEYHTFMEMVREARKLLKAEG